MKESTTIKFLYLVLGAVLGFALFGALRFTLYKPDTTHYHANFAVYVNGVRNEFKDPSFYEEVSACNKDEIGPKHRAHLHNNTSDVVHVHDHAVTWGAFFANLGYSMSDKYLQARTKLYLADDTNTVHFVLNGKEISDVSNTVIGDQDRLLVNFGNDNAVGRQKQFESVANTAAAVDKAKDPAACSGAEAITTQDRLQHLFQ